MNVVPVHNWDKKNSELKTSQYSFQDLKWYVAKRRLQSSVFYYYPWALKISAVNSSEIRWLTRLFIVPSSSLFNTNCVDNGVDSGGHSVIKWGGLKGSHRQYE